MRVILGCYGLLGIWLSPKGSEFSGRSLGIGGALGFSAQLRASSTFFYAMLHLERGEPELTLRRLGTAEALAMDQRLAFIVEPQFFRGLL
jgi:hypothetical protein